MPSVVHVVTTANFAGVERYIAETARETAARGWDVAVVGGDPRRMARALGPEVEWRAGGDPVTALVSLARVGRRDICHAHMTIAEAVALIARPFHRSVVISTRHFSGHRGASRVGRVVSPSIASRLAREVAVSHFVADRLERPPHAVLPSGVRTWPMLWRADSRVVLVLQRLEREKDTLTALRAWHASRLADDGWSLHVVGEGSQRQTLEAWVSQRRLERVEFLGWSDDIEAAFSRAGMLLAPAADEAFGFAVVEAMAAGIPVVASAAGGHLETIGKVDGAPLFPPGDSRGAAAALRGCLSEATRRAASEAGRRLVESSLTIETHVDRLLLEYEAANRTVSPSRTPRSTRGQIS
jgi:glycosyltransferase involved in cell wall biosynthesis